MVLLSSIFSRIGYDTTTVCDATNITKYGNTSSAGIGIGLDELNKKTDLTGKRVLLTGFGAGFTYGSLLLEF